MPAPKLTSEIIVAAILGFEAQKTRIDARIAELRAMLGGGPTEPAAQEAPRGKGKKRSAAARKRMAEAQRKRWAESKGVAGSPASPATAKPKRRISAAGKAAIVAALKKRWAAKKAAATPKPAKKATGKKTAA